MNLNKEIPINPKVSRAVIRIFCVLGIIHEMILALSRLELSVMMPSEIFFLIGNNYSNNIKAEVIALFFRLFIFFAIIFASSQNKKFVKLTKSLVYTKVFRVLLLYLSIYSWIYVVNNYSPDMYDTFRGPHNIIHIAALYGFIAIEAVLSVILIIKSTGKVRTIFVLAFIASLLDTFVFKIMDFLYMFTSASLEGFIYFIASVLYIICFVKTIMLVKNAADAE